MDSADRMVLEGKSEKGIYNGGDAAKTKGLYDLYSDTRKIAKISSSTKGDFRGGRIYISFYSVD